jgi:hypothetical protein
MQESLVSVHMITYNHAPYIAKAIECVLGQKTDFPFELVIGEDCSTDGTREIVFDYAKRHPGMIRVIISENNVGMVKNGYRTAMACTGKYIAFCEGDDYWHSPDKLMKQTKLMKKKTDCGLVCSDYDVFYTTSKKRIRNVNARKKRDPEKLKNIIHTLRGVSGIQTCTVLIRADLYKKIITDNVFYLDPSQPCLDRPLWMDILRESDLAYIDESLATYNLLDTSATQSTDPAKILKTSIRMKEQILFLIDKHNLPEEEKNIHQRDLWKRQLKLAFYEGNSELAITSKRQLNKITLIEQLQYLGACNNHIKLLLFPIFKRLFKGIPTSNF